jgi:hypothetical protein
MTNKLSDRSSSAWRWLRWMFLSLVIVGGIAACFFMVAIHPHKNVLRLERNYPQRNSNPTHVVSINGTIPSDLQIKFLAHYGASRVEGHESCYRNMALGPTFPLYLVEPLDEVRTASTYTVSVTVDKYQTGECGWSLDFVGYQLLDEDRDVVEDGLERGGAK